MKEQVSQCYSLADFCVVYGFWTTAELYFTEEKEIKLWKNRQYLCFCLKFLQQNISIVTKLILK